jgi:hypothetical protein
MTHKALDFIMLDALETRKDSMPTPRKSIVELALSGSLSAHPGRYKARFETEPIVSLPLGPTPRHLNADQRRVWAELLRSSPLGLWTRSDRLALEVVTNMVLQMRQPNATFRDFNALMSLLGKLGCTPEGRRKLGIELPSKPPVIDPKWAELDALD